MFRRHKILLPILLEEQVLNFNFGGALVNELYIHMLSI